jgi:hypothetical protein
VRLFSDAALLYNAEEENVNAARLQVLTAFLVMDKVSWCVTFCRLEYEKVGLPYPEQDDYGNFLTIGNFLSLYIAKCLRRFYSSDVNVV